MGPHETSPKPSFTKALALWGRIGILSFGGPAGQIALMHRLLVDERRWITEERFLHALNFCMLLPGPEAMQLATSVGWRLHGTLGGLAAGLLFVLPGALIVLGLSIAYAYYGQVPAVEAAFVGVKAAVLVIVIEALVRVAKRALRGPHDDRFERRREWPAVPDSRQRSREPPSPRQPGRPVRPPCRPRAQKHRPVA